MNDTQITVIGNAVDDPELRFTPAGQPVARFRVASTPRVRDKATGEWKDGEALFLTVNVWRAMAEHACESIQRGTRVVVDGRLRQRSCETREGEQRTVYEIEAGEIGVSVKFAACKVAKAERWRKGPAPRGSGPSIVKALDQVAEIMGLELAALRIEDLVPPRRLADLSRYGMTAKAQQMRRHPAARRLATLMATVRHLEAKSIDDTLELLDLLMTTELLGKAHMAADKEKVRKHPALVKVTSRLLVAAGALVESEEWGSEDEVVVAAVWEAVAAVMSRAELRAAVKTAHEIVPPPDVGAEANDWRAELAGRISTASGFVKLLTSVIVFGANAEGEQVLKAMQALPDVLAHRARKSPASLVPGTLIDAAVVSGPWKHLVFGHPAREDGSVDRNAYTFCVLEQFWRHLKRREIYAGASTRWRNPQAGLLDGAAWEAVKEEVLTTLGLPDDPGALLSAHIRTLDAAYREVGGRLNG